MPRLQHHVSYSRIVTFWAYVATYDGPPVASSDSCSCLKLLLFTLNLVVRSTCSGMIIGSVVMTGYDVVFDRTTTPHRVGFAASKCGVPDLVSTPTAVPAPHARGWLVSPDLCSWRVTRMCWMIVRLACHQAFCANLRLCSVGHVVCCGGLV